MHGYQFRWVTFRMVVKKKKRFGVFSSGSCLCRGQSTNIKTHTHTYTQRLIDRYLAGMRLFQPIPLINPSICLREQSIQMNRYTKICVCKTYVRLMPTSICIYEFLLSFFTSTMSTSKLISMFSV